MVRKAIPILFIFGCTNLAIGQSRFESQDSMMQFLIRGLWIQYEIEKLWNPNTDTTISYSDSELQLYYQGRDLGDSLLSMEPKYSDKISVYFELKTGKTRNKIHRAQHMISVLDKQLILTWTDWYQRNKSKVNLNDLKSIVH